MDKGRNLFYRNFPGMASMGRKKPSDEIPESCGGRNLNLVSLACFSRFFQPEHMPMLGRKTFYGWGRLKARLQHAYKMVIRFVCSQ
jgi:hypothetical protein